MTSDTPDRNSRATARRRCAKGREGRQRRRPAAREKGRARHTRQAGKRPHHDMAVPLAAHRHQRQAKQGVAGEDGDERFANGHERQRLAVEMIDQRRPRGREQAAHQPADAAEDGEAPMRGKLPARRRPPHQLQAGQDDDQAQDQPERRQRQRGHHQQRRVAERDQGDAAGQRQQEGQAGDVAPAAGQHHEGVDQRQQRDHHRRFRQRHQAGERDAPHQHQPEGEAGHRLHIGGDEAQQREKGDTEGQGHDQAVVARRAIRVHHRQDQGA